MGPTNWTRSQVEKYPSLWGHSGQSFERRPRGWTQEEFESVELGLIHVEPGIEPDF
jgi:hypothetical protein